MGVFNNWIFMVMHVPFLSDVDVMNTRSKIILCTEIIEQQFPDYLVTFKQALSAKPIS